MSNYSLSFRTSKLSQAWAITALGLPVSALLYTTFSWDYFGVYKQWNYTAVPLYSVIAFIHYAYSFRFVIPDLKRGNYTIFALHLFISLVVLTGLFGLVYRAFIGPGEMEGLIKVLYADKALNLLQGANFLNSIKVFGAFLYCYQ